MNGSVGGWRSVILDFGNSNKYPREVDPQLVHVVAYRIYQAEVIVPGFKGTVSPDNTIL